MKLLIAVSLMSGLLGMVPGHLPKNGDRMCVYQVISQGDASFCTGNLNVIYPEIGDIGCMYVPDCNNFRQKMGSWGKPAIKYSQAHENKKYVLMMVDPDAPSRYHPKNRYWRHWLITDISMWKRRPRGKEWRQDWNSGLLTSSPVLHLLCHTALPSLSTSLGVHCFPTGSSAWAWSPLYKELKYIFGIM
ncbi:phosphatidylethanolamine-binding protein 4 isoform X3 [Antechinus flavipes]|uniref:phosphatidylethanolamine-binding protein 4 isoform X3 n=1 Tax=Antechinus flavipes TaxID=38775 RepID=UPI002235F776|nr:phosphatidylethanolamine-binding protein 4 isoform X3 [Antechinus flavipes]